MSKKYQKIEYPKDYEVYWEEWIDPYDNNETDKFKKYLNEYGTTEEEDDLFGDDDEGTDSLSYDSTLPPFQQPIKTIFTPYGLLPINDKSIASKQFKFWTGHTNFKLLNSFIKIIEDCEGVETVTAMTPYRFRIGIGILFQDRNVMGDVRKALLGYFKKS